MSEFVGEEYWLTNHVKSSLNSIVRSLLAVRRGILTKKTPSKMPKMTITRLNPDGYSMVGWLVSGHRFSGSLTVIFIVIMFSSDGRGDAGVVIAKECE